ncbi:MAG: fructose-6-phosphate aldolase [Candidatus Fermentibacteraceae bacterium]|nr:fructose-6-phosphate aldolase [Candidatus Fermentibacteraceae bacterium]MBN2607765.1 fructose-6-phosphate aldolase [Candidatus Fermentibacteraceae bacterium]
MKLFLDTANVEEIREIASWGILSGVTTNPSLVAREGRDFREVIREICGIVDGPISAEVISTDRDGMITEAREKSGWHENVVIKIPMGSEGLAAVSVLEKEGIKCNVTLVFSAAQGYTAALAGASFVSPFVGRLDDIGIEGMNVVADLAEIYDLHGFPTRIIAASIRHTQHVEQAALAGAHIATVPASVVRKLVKHPLTDIGLKKFLEDWNSQGK